MTIGPVSRSSSSYYIQPVRKVQNTVATDKVKVVQATSQEQIKTQENVANTTQRRKTTDKATGIANAQHILSAKINQNVFNQTQSTSNGEGNASINREPQNSEDSQNLINNISIHTADKSGDITLDTINKTLDEIRDQVISATTHQTKEEREFSQEQINQLLEKLDSDLKDLNIGYDLENLGLEDMDVTNDTSVNNSLESIDNAIRIVSYKEETPLGLNNSTKNSITDELEKLYALGTTASETNSSSYKELLQGEVEKVKDTISDTLKNTGVTLKDLGLEDFDVTEKFSLNTIDNAMKKVTGENSTLGYELNTDSIAYNDNNRINTENTLSNNNAWQEVLQKFTNFSETYQYKSYLNILNLFSGEYSQVATTFNMFS